jgi:chemotaxis signal transduction protein
MNVKSGESLPAPATLTSAGARYIESIVKTGDRIIVLLDIEKIFSEQEQDELKEITGTQGGKIEESIDS